MKIKSFIDVDGLFSQKEIYTMSCTDTGKFHYLMDMSKAQRAKVELNNMHLATGMVFTEEHGIPLLHAYEGPTHLPYVPYSSRNIAIHFFEDDYKFATATWKRLDRTTYTLARYPVLCTPDHSLYVDMPKSLNLWSIYKSRFAGAFWQNCGFDVIPTASWSNADSFSWCFEGLPQHSVIAVCGMGVDGCSAASELWLMGMHSLEYTLHPTELLVYGEERNVPGISPPITFISPYIKSKFRTNESRK
jgi:hypothetical protein